MSTDLYQEGNTDIKVGDFVYLNNDDNKGFDHVVLIIGIDPKSKKYIIAHASGQDNDFVIDLKGIEYFENQEILGTLNILGETP